MGLIALILTVLIGIVSIVGISFGIYLCVTGKKQKNVQLEEKGQNMINLFSIVSIIFVVLAVIGICIFLYMFCTDASFFEKIINNLEKF